MPPAPALAQVAVQAAGELEEGILADGDELIVKDKDVEASEGLPGVVQKIGHLPYGAEVDAVVAVDTLRGDEERAVERSSPETR